MQTDGLTPGGDELCGPVARRPSPALVGVAVAAIAALIVYFAAGIFLFFFAAILFSVLLRGLGDVLGHLTGLRRGWSLALAVIVLVLVFGLFGWLAASRIVAQLDALEQQLSRGFQELQTYLGGSDWGRHLRERAGEAVRGASPAGIFDRLTGAVSRSVGGIVDLFIVLFLGLYLASAPGRYVKGILHLVPFRYRGRTREVLGSLDQTLRRWLAGRLLSMALVGLMTGLALWFVHAPLPVTLGVLTGLMNFVPNFGPLAAAMITGLVALSASPAVALEAIVAQVLVGAFDGFVITPLIQDRAVSLPPGLILGSQALIGALLGGPGLVLATPLTAAIFVLVRELYVRDVLRDSEA